jgi:soluble lytic murein transglycosylase-like protein
MVRVKYSFAFKASLILAASAAAPQIASAQSIVGKKPFDDCPLNSPLRVSAAQTVGDYESLGACSSTVIAASKAPIPELPSVVRIIGVKEDAKRRDRVRREASDPGFEPISARSSRLAYDAHIVRAAANHRIDPLFLHAIIGTESAYRPNAVSHANAIGLMQIIPSTGQTLGVQKAGLYDPATNIDAGARLLKRLQRRYGRDFDLILASYNAGEGAVAKYGNKIPPYRETQGYVRKVMSRYHALRGGASK